MEKLFKITLILVLIIVFGGNLSAQKWEAKSYLRIEKMNTYLTTWAKNAQDLGSGYSFNTFVLLSDGIGISDPWGEAVLGVEKKHKDWSFEGLVGFQQSIDGIDLMVKPSWGYSKNKFSIFNSWEFGVPSGSWWWTAHVKYKVYKDSYVGIMSRRKHGTGLELGIAIRQFEIHLARLWDTEIGEWKSVVGFKIKIEPNKK